MYAVFTVVEIDKTKSDMAAAIKSLMDDIIPQLEHAPGFVRGTWFGNDATGHSVVLFDTEEQASQATQEVNSIPAVGVRVVSSAVYELHAQA
jgi:hypothetical protein